VEVFLELGGEGEVGMAMAEGWVMLMADAWSAMGGTDAGAVVGVVGVVDEDAVLAVDGEVDVVELGHVAVGDEATAEALGDAMHLVAEGEVEGAGVGDVFLEVDGWDTAGVAAGGA
jgi:hypothetical protein